MLLQRGTTFRLGISDISHAPVLSTFEVGEDTSHSFGNDVAAQMECHRFNG